MLITFLLITVLVLTLASYIINRTGYRGRVQRYIDSLKKKLFFNMLIAFTLLNALKFYVLAFTNLNGVDTGIEKKIAAGFILLILVLLPLFYARLLYKREL